MNEKQIRESILENLEIVLRKREGNLVQAIQSLDTLKARARGHLSHYLVKRSYEKAWLLLNGGDPEKGICG